MSKRKIGWFRRHRVGMTLIAGSDVLLETPDTDAFNSPTAAASENVKRGFNLSGFSGTVRVNYTIVRDAGAGSVHVTMYKNGVDTGIPEVNDNGGSHSVDVPFNDGDSLEIRCYVDAGTTVRLTDIFLSCFVSGQAATYY